MSRESFFILLELYQKHEFQICFFSTVKWFEIWFLVQ